MISLDDGIDVFVSSRICSTFHLNQSLIIIQCLMDLFDQSILIAERHSITLIYVRYHDIPDGSFRQVLIHLNITPTVSMIHLAIQIFAIPHSAVILRQQKYPIGIIQCCCVLHIYTSTFCHSIFSLYLVIMTEYVYLKIIALIFSVNMNVN